MFWFICRKYMSVHTVRHSKKLLKVSLTNSQTESLALFGYAYFAIPMSSQLVYSWESVHRTCFLGTRSVSLQWSQSAGGSGSIVTHTSTDSWWRWMWRNNVEEHDASRSFGCNETPNAIKCRRSKRFQPAASAQPFTLLMGVHENFHLVFGHLFEDLVNT